MVEADLRRVPRFGPGGKRRVLDLRRVVERVRAWPDNVTPVVYDGPQITGRILVFFVRVRPSEISPEAGGSLSDAAVTFS